MSACRRMQIDLYLSPCTKFKSEWIKDFNVKPDKINLIELKVGKSLELTGSGDNFLNRRPKAPVLRSTIDKWELIKLQSFWKALKVSANKTKKISLQIGKGSLLTLHLTEG